MADEFLLLCKFRMDTVVLKFNVHGIFSDLVCQICANWNSLNSDNVTIFYSIPGHYRILLRNQVELDLMFCLVKELGLKTIEIGVDVCNALCVSSSGGGVSSNVTISSDNVTISRDDVTIAPFLLDEGSHNISITHIDGNSNIISQSSTSMDTTLLSSNWANAISKVGQVFEGGVKEFRSALCRYSVELGFKFVYMRNTKKHVSAVCASKYSHGCNWYIFASSSKVNGYFYVRKFINEHICGVLLSNGDSKRLSYNHMGELVVEQLKDNPSLTAVEVKKFFRTNYGLIVAYKKAWQCLEKAKSVTFGDQSESYNSLRWYVEAALQTNPGSHIVLDVVASTKRFSRIFMSFNASVIGFRFCRPMLFLDGTFLKGLYKGMLLSATAKDGNQGVAFYINNFI